MEKFKEQLHESTLHRNHSRNGLHASGSCELVQLVCFLNENQPGVSECIL